MDHNDSRLVLDGAHLRVAIGEWYPYVIGRTVNGTRTYTGFCMDILKVLAHTLNFTYDLVTSPDGEWGDYRDGNYTGLIGLVHRKEIDLIGAPMILSPERTPVADWVLPYDYWYYKVLIRQPDLTVSSLWTMYLQPFHWQVYVCIAATFLCCTCLFLCVVKVERSLTIQESQIRPPTVDRVLQFLVGTSLRQSVPVVWEGGKAMRLLSASWYLLGLVLASAYTCRMTSLLATVMPSPPFTSLTEMVSRENFKWGTLGGTATLFNMRHSNDKLLQAVYQGMMTFAEDDPDVLSIDHSVHVEKVMAGNYGFIAETMPDQESVGEPVMEILIPQLGIQMYTIYLQKQSPLTWRVQTVLLRLQESGILQHLRDRWFPKFTEQHRRKSSETIITWSTIQGPVYVCVGGLALAAIVLMAERVLCWKRYRLLLQK